MFISNFYNQIFSTKKTNKISGGFYKNSIFQALIFSPFALVTATHILLIICFLLNFTTNKNQNYIISFAVDFIDENSSSNRKVSSQLVAKSTSLTSKNLSDTGEVNQSSLAGKKSDNSLNSIQQNSSISKNSQAIYDASYLSNKSPKYPETSRKLGEQGLVVLSVYVTNQGKAEKVSIKNSSGYNRLDDVAIETVKSWNFVSAKKNGQSIASWVQIPINFVLEKNV